MDTSKCQRTSRDYIANHEAYVIPSNYWLMVDYAEQIAALARAQNIDVRKAPDPTREVIQHQLLKARGAAGSDGYIVAFHGGHGIQEAPTEAGELWCYDRSFEEFIETGHGPSE
jgi:regulator-associated protein of mTOR